MVALLLFLTSARPVLETNNKAVTRRYIFPNISLENTQGKVHCSVV